MKQDKGPAKLSFEAGTLLLENLPLSRLPIELLRKIKWDERVGCHRAMAYLYAPLVLALRDADCPYEDYAREFKPLTLTLNTDFELRSHQKEAFDAWKEADCRAVTALPTGSGKTFLAVNAIKHLSRPALIMVPTIDLLQQWATQLEEFFQQPIGMLGGGAKDIKPITVTTYDSAVIHMEFIGDKFGLLVFDECHHLPGPVNRIAASMSIAPFRLGLTATPELEDEPTEALNEYIGPLCCQIHIDQLEGKVLAPYATRQEKVKLDDDEAVAYQENRKLYVDFLKKHGITFQQRNDWARFIGLCARMPDGREVLNAFMEQKRIARGGRAKVRRTWELIQEHQGERIIIFTAENDTAYMLGRKFFMPVLTHRTKVTERKEMLEMFRSGEYPVLVTSKVLNEGVDVPEASVGIIVSGSGSIREHVQRLGRILRASEGKQAVLYELISERTSEENVSRRRREHRAYRRSGKSFRRRY
ncbi:MAG: DEAD/DEAH box helicase [Lentisphaerae bacterium]|nr:DEAD/DEAH box helicase [Lentisphaerota bacterium]MCP4100223.1 DEAD/DEAH box helicase [Lentisphaerota bacterium]